MKEMTRLELERQEAQTRENALAEAVASKKKQLLTDLVIWIHRCLFLNLVASHNCLQIW